jgi:ABC-type glutathione transport system ATPase component
MTIFDTLAEAIRTHRKIPRRELSARVAALMSKVGLHGRDVKKYPHEFSATAHSPAGRSAFADESTGRVPVSSALPIHD